MMIAGGLNGMVLPLRGSTENFSTLSLGLLGTGWAFGYIAGCIWTPKLVRRAGHVRTFSTLSSMAVLSVLTSLLFIDPTAWILLRALAGFAFAGAAMIVESWLNERTDRSYRGRVFGVYTMVNLAATTGGQLLAAVGDPAGHVLFVLAAIFYSLSLVPSALTKTAQPKPLVQTGLDLRVLIRNSPLAVVGVFLIGMSNSTFGTLGVVYGSQVGLDVSSIALMMSLSLLAGSLVQAPVGLLSDRIDRRIVLVALAALAAVTDLYFILARPESAMAILIAASVFGMAIYSMYPVLAAHANDHASADDFLKISGGLLLVFGVGGIVGPIGAGIAMSWSPASMFVTTLVAHLALLAYGLYRMRKREAVADVDKGLFVGIPSARMSTPQTGTLDPRNDAMHANGDDASEALAPSEDGTE